MGAFHTQKKKKKETHYKTNFISKDEPISE